MAEGHNRYNWLADTLSNRPFIVGALYLGTYFVPFLILIGVALAYVFKREPEEEWEASHFEFLIRTFWLPVLALAAFLVGLVAFAYVGSIRDLPISDDDAVFAIVVAMLTVMVPVLVFCGVRIVLSLMKSAAHKPITNPKGWLG